MALIKNNYSTYDPPKPMFTINTQILYLSTNNTQLFFEIHVKNEKKNLSTELIHFVRISTLAQNMSEEKLS